MIPLRRRASATRLFAVYSLASLVPLCVLGAVLARGYHQQSIEQGRLQGLAQAAVIEEMAIAPALGGVDLARGLTAVERDRLASATDLAIFNGSVTHLRLRSFEGRVPFSDDGSVVGAVPATDPAFVAATRGRTTADIVAGADAQPAIRVLQPVIASSNGRAVGVLEVYLPYSAIAAKARADTRHTVLRLGFGLLGLFVVLAMISWATTRALRRQAASHEHDALHDPLTGLPNRELFRRAAESALARPGAGGALVLLDLDHFKQVNDSLGHHAGDELLRVVSRRLVGALRTDDTVARLGGDEFGLVLPQVAHAQEAVVLLGAVQRALGQVVTLEGTAISVEASVGLCLYPDGAATVEDLMQRADAAMYEGKRGASGIVVYDPTLRPVHATHSLALQHELREALTRDELTVHYQPKIDLVSGQVRGVEALVRWNHPERGLLPPSQFLSVAEHSGLITPLTTWVLNRSLDDYLQWTAAGCDWTVAVNVSARNLDSADFVVEVTSALAQRGIEADRLCVEVTESVLAADAQTAMDVLNALAVAGVRTSIDDFGAGYTSLAQMRSLQVAEVKIDRTFVSGLPGNTQDACIVAAMIDLGHRLGCEVTAEGVESTYVAGWLTRQGCDQAQGYLWLRPCPWPEVAAFARDRRPHPSPHEKALT
ncbi:MAG: EAL domain-containing protein [Actinomycetota bacterium]